MHVTGVDDTGAHYESLAALRRVQSAGKAEFYATNERWWSAGGYGGSSMECRMIGDESSEADIASSSRPSALPIWANLRLH